MTGAAAGGLSPGAKDGLHAAIGALLQEQAQASATPKQLLRVLAKRGRLNPSQLRALSARYDEETKSDVRETERYDVLERIAREYDAGSLQVDGAAAKSQRAPGVFDCPAGEGPKQVLMWCMARGSLSKEEVRRAAAAMNEAEDLPKWTRDDVAALLYRLELFNALPPGWAPENVVDEDADELAAARAKRPTEDELWAEERETINWEALVRLLEQRGGLQVPVDVARMWSQAEFVTVGDWINRGAEPAEMPELLAPFTEEAAAATEAYRARADEAAKILQGTVPIVEAAVKSIHDVELLHIIEDTEAGGQKRVGVKNAVEERLGELELAAELDKA